MFTHIRVFVYWTIGIFLLMIALSGIGSALERSTSPAMADLKAFYEHASGAIFGTLFFLLGFVMIPVVLRLFVRLQAKIGNADLPLVAFIQQHECTITYVVWGIMATFIAVMWPTIVEDMKG